MDRFFINIIIVYLHISISVMGKYKKTAQVQFRDGTPEERVPLSVFKVLNVGDYIIIFGDQFQIEFKTWNNLTDEYIIMVK